MRRELNPDLPAHVSRLGTVPALDGLRALAVLSVFAVHLDWTVSGHGVTVFFALSGFLITALLLEEKDQNGRVAMGRFFARRGLRLLPALLVFLVADVAYTMATRADAASRGNHLKQVAATLLYANNWLIGLRQVPDDHLSHTWSLAVEEQFYIVWPFALLAILALAHCRKRSAAWVALLALSFTGERYLLAGIFPHERALEYRIYNGTDARLDALLYGAAAAFAFRDRLFLTGWGAGALAWLAAVLLVAHLFGNVGAEPRSLSPTSLAAYLGVALATTALVYALALRRPELKPLEWLLTLAPVRYLGRVSYGLYLWHPLACVVAKEQFPNLDGVSAVALKILGAMVPTMLSYHLVEKPCLRWKGRFAPPARAAAPAAPGTVPLAAAAAVGSRPSGPG